MFKNCIFIVRKVLEMTWRPWRRSNVDEWGTRIRQPYLPCFPVTNSNFLWSYSYGYKKSKANFLQSLHKNHPHPNVDYSRCTNNLTSSSTKKVMKKSRYWVIISTSNAKHPFNWEPIKYINLPSKACCINWWTFNQTKFVGDFNPMNEVCVFIPVCVVWSFRKYFSTSTRPLD